MTDDASTDADDAPPPRAIYTAMRTDDLRLLLDAFLADLETLTDDVPRAFVQRRIAALRDELARRARR